VSGYRRVPYLTRNNVSQACGSVFLLFGSRPSNTNKVQIRIQRLNDGSKKQWQTFISLFLNFDSCVMLWCTYFSGDKSQNVKGKGHFGDVLIDHLKIECNFNPGTRIRIISLDPDPLPC